jgi:amidophosphoribosyltransferase
MRHLATRFDGAYSLAMLNAQGQMIVARDPLGIKPMCYAIDGPLFAAASESVALLNLGFPTSSIRSLEPGTAVTISDGKIEIEKFCDNPRRAHCFFEWIYFANVASTMDDRSVYLARKALGEELARMEDLERDENTVVVPVPDTSKAAADSMAYQLGVPSVEGLIRNRYSGRTFIEGGADRKLKAASKYTALPEVMRGKRILLVEDSIVRSTTMRVLISKIREIGQAKEIHVRVACPPIVAPCFYGIDMSTIGELFAPKFIKEGQTVEEMHAEMAAELGADSLRFLPIESISRALEKGKQDICQACINGEYPTPCGQQLYQVALENYREDPGGSQRTYESATS